VHPERCAERNETVCNPMCGEPPASGARVGSLGAWGGYDECGGNPCSVWQMQKIITF